MPITIKYPNNPNIDTAFVEQEGGTKNRALMIAPQDISTLELPNNPNSTKGYITVDGKKQRVVLTADITGGGSSLPDQTGHSGEFLTTDGTDASWAAVNALPSQTGHSGEFLTTDGTDASWSAVNALPTQTGNSGKFLTTDGTDASWATVSALQNTATGTDSLTILGTTTTSNYATNTGVLSEAGTNATAYGYHAIASGTSSCAFGEYSEASGARSLAIGDNAYATAADAIQLGAAGGNNSDANTFKVYNGNGNYEIMSADGTIPTARLTKVNSTVTLTSAGWSSNTQTVTVTGMTATGVVLVSPDPTDQSAYTSAGIICTAQAADSLTFTCSTTPLADLSVNVVML